MTDQLVAFLRERLDEDAEAAQAADEREGDWWWGPDAESPAERHIARHDPARVLAEIDAKRRILAEHAAAVEDDAEDPHDTSRSTAMVTLADVLRLLALPYAGHEGFREEWRP